MSYAFRPLGAYSVVLIVLVASLVYYWTQNYEKSPVVGISSGNVQGLAATSRNGRRFYLYLGIPYAQPPVGMLRFESPQPANKWNGTLDASVHGPECKGFDFFFTGRVQGEESCLFLNVYTPEAALSSDPQKANSLLPVIVHIHGGAFQTGSIQPYDGSYFMDHDIVLVNIQYRLGIFGFLNTNDETVRGNMALKDQVLALKWVQQNIIQFGGDPNQVTIMGESAGGTSVHLLMLSPMAKGLFHRAITMGVEGTTDIWQYNHDVTGKKNIIAEHFNCPKESQDFVQCMRAIDADTLASYHSLFVTPYIFNNSAGLGPSIEKFGGPDAFLTEHPMTLLKNGSIANQVPWMVGANDNEGLLFLGMLLRFVELHDLMDDKNWENYLPHLLFYDKNRRPDAAAKIKHHFFGSNELSVQNETDIIVKLSALITEKMFFNNAVQSAKQHAKSAPVYMYLYTYKGFLSLYNLLLLASPTSFLGGELGGALNVVQNLFQKYILRKPQPHFGAAHSDDVILMFKYPIISIVANYFDLEMSQLLVKTYVDFATYEQPTFQGLPWPAINSSESLHWMELNTGKPTILQDPSKTRLKFWEELNLPPP